MNFIYFVIILMKKRGYTYIMASKKRGVLYVGVTSNLYHRVRQHKNEVNEGFTKRYHIHFLVRYQKFDLIIDAIAYEKQLKGRLRSKKIALIEEDNPYWNDLML